MSVFLGGGLTFIEPDFLYSSIVGGIVAVFGASAIEPNMETPRRIKEEIKEAALTQLIDEKYLPPEPHH